MLMPVQMCVCNVVNVIRCVDVGEEVEWSGNRKDSRSYFWWGVA